MVASPASPKPVSTAVIWSTDRPSAAGHDRHPLAIGRVPNVEGLGLPVYDERRTLGTALGFWVADVPGASWGKLAVFALDQQTGALTLDAPLLAPTLARRSFTLGHNRAAWVGPAEQSPDGELRISVWGPDGSGVLRFSDPDLYRLLAAF